MGSSYIHSLLKQFRPESEPMEVFIHLESYQAPSL